MDNKDSLIDRIEEVKEKIAEFESNLNINSIDIDKVTVDRNNELINQIESYKSRINNIEKDVVNNKTTYPIEQEPLLSNRKIETFNSIAPELKDKEPHTDIKKTINKVEMEKQEVENINDLLEKLKKNALEQEKINAEQEIKKVQNKTEIKSKNVNSINNKKTEDYTNKSSVDSPVSKVESYSEPSKVNPNTVNITENDLHSMSELISKLDELLRSNKEIADKLNELLSEQRTDDSKVSKNNELIKKLAILGSNSNLS